MTIDPASRRGLNKMAPGSLSGGFAPANPTQPNFNPFISEAVGGNCIAHIISDGTTTVMETDIPAGFADLEIRLFGTSTETAGLSFSYLEFNSDSDTNYWWSMFQASEISVDVLRGVDLGSENDIGIPFVTEFNGLSTPYVPACSLILVPEYSNDTFWKVASGWGNHITVNNGGGSIYGSEHQLVSGLWRNTSPITHVAVSSTPFGGAGDGVFVAGSSLLVMGKC